MEVLLITPDILKKESNIDSSIDDKKISIAISDAQLFGLKTAIGTSLYTKIIKAVEEKNLTMTDKILLKEMQSYLIKAATYEIIDSVLFQIGANSVVTNSSDNSESLSIEQLNIMKKSLAAKRDLLLFNLKEFLDSNLSKFPEYTPENSTLADNSYEEFGMGGFLIYDMEDL